MKTYRVEVETTAREVYYVEADSEGEAYHNWHRGTLDLSENTSGEPKSVELVEDDE